MKRPFQFYEWPEALFPLREWLRRQGCDTAAFKSERQAYFMARMLSHQRGRFPQRGKPLFPALLKLQKSVCSGTHRTIQRSRDLHVPGTFGPASSVRHIDPAAYLAEKRAGAHL